MRNKQIRASFIYQNTNNGKYRDNNSHKEKCLLEQNHNISTDTFSFFNRNSSSYAVFVCELPLEVF